MGCQGNPQKNKMASQTNAATTAIVALALRELALSQGGEQGLSEFLTEYFASDDRECFSGK